MYVGIRITLSSISSDKAKYKQMLMDWAVALCLVFLMHYIMAFSVTINEKIIKAISAISGSSAEEKENAVKNAKEQYLNGSTEGNDGSTTQNDEVGTGIELFIIDDDKAVERAYKTLVGDEEDVNVNEGYVSNDASYFIIVLYGGMEQEMIKTNSFNLASK